MLIRLLRRHPTLKQDWLRLVPLLNIWLRSLFENFVFITIYFIFSYVSHAPLRRQLLSPGWFIHDVRRAHAERSLSTLKGTIFGFWWLLVPWIRVSSRCDVLKVGFFWLFVLYLLYLVFFSDWEDCGDVRCDMLAWDCESMILRLANSVCTVTWNGQLNCFIGCFLFILSHRKLHMDVWYLRSIWWDATKSFTCICNYGTTFLCLFRFCDVFLDNSFATMVATALSGVFRTRTMHFQMLLKFLLLLRF